MKIKPYEDPVDTANKPAADTPTRYGMAGPYRAAVHSDIERQDAMINDLIQLTRLQNTEINNLRQELRRISTVVSAVTEKEDGLRAEMNELKQQISTLRTEQQQQQGEKDCDNTPTKLTRKAHVAIRDPQTVKDRIIAAVREDVTAQTLELEHKQGTSMLAIKRQIYGLEMIMSSMLSGIGRLYKTLVPPSETRDEISSIEHYYGDLEQKKGDLMEKLHKQADLSSISKQQILLQHQFSALSTALDQRARKQRHDVEEGEKPADMKKQILKLSKTVDSQMQVLSNHNLSIGSHREEIGRIQSCLASLQSVLEFFEKEKHDSDGLKSRMLAVEQKVANHFNTPPHSPWAPSWSSMPHDDGVAKIPELSTKVESQQHDLDELAHRVLVVENTGEKHKNSLFSDGKDLVLLQKRLTYAETLIGEVCRLYALDHISILGRTFYKDARSLRFISKSRIARAAFSELYGNRAEAARFVEIAPPVVVMAFNAIARVRCNTGSEMWQGKLNLKREIQHVAEAIIHSWEKMLPLREGDEHVPCEELFSAGSGDQLKFKQLCRRANMDFGPEPWYEIQWMPMA